MLNNSTSQEHFPGSNGDMMRDLDTNSDNTLPLGAEAARTWGGYRSSLTASGAGKAELEQFDRVTRRGFLTAVGKGALALGLFGAGPVAAGKGLFGRGSPPQRLGEHPGRRASQAGHDHSGIIYIIQQGFYSILTREIKDFVV